MNSIIEAPSRPCIGDTVRYYAPSEFASTYRRTAPDQSPMPFAAIVTDIKPQGSSWQLRLAVFTPNGEILPFDSIPFLHKKGSSDAAYKNGYAIASDSIDRSIERAGVLVEKANINAANAQGVASRVARDIIQEKLNDLERQASISLNYLNGIKTSISSLSILEGRCANLSAKIDSLDIKESDARKTYSVRVKDKKKASAFIGQVVRLRSGGADMVAAEMMDGGLIKCIHSDSVGNVRFYEIPMAALIQVAPNSAG